MASMAPRPHALTIGSLPIGVRLAPVPGRAPACDRCGQRVVGTGGRRYGAVVLCPPCSTACLQAWASGQHWHPAQFVRDQRSG